MVTTGDEQNDVIEAAEPSMTWRAHPARTRLRRAVHAGAVILLIGAAVAAWLAVDGAAWYVATLGGAIASGVLVLALNRFYFASTFTIDDESITAAYLLKTETMRWRDVRRFLHDENGGFLSRRARPTRFDAFQGLHLIWGGDGDHREAMVELIRQRLEVARARESEPGA